MNRMTQFAYPLTFTPDDVDGGYVVTLRDFPEAITQGDTLEDALAQGEDALDEAVANRIAMELELPVASAARAGEYIVTVPASTALKAAFYLSIRELDLSKVQLAALLGVDEKEVRRLLDPRHPSKLTRIEELMGRLGKRIMIQVADAQSKAVPGHEPISADTLDSSATKTELWNPAKLRANLYEMPQPVKRKPDVDEIAS